MATYASDILFSIDTALQMKGGLNAETIAVNKTLTYKDSTYQALKNVTGGLDVILPSPKSGCSYWIKSRASSSSNTTVKDHNAASIKVLTPGDGVLVACDDSAWYDLS